MICRRSVASASAPGKIILFGEHFVVYNNPAILASINKRIKVRAQINKTDKINVKSNGLFASYASSSLPKDIRSKFTKAQRILYPLYKSAIGVLAEQDNKKIGVDMDLVSDFPSGVGLGSSAASCVSAVAAVTSLFDKPDKNEVCSKAIQAERIIHNSSSGADCYISTFGGLIYYAKNKGYKDIKLKTDLSFLVVNTGIKHSTRTLVSSVRRFREGNMPLFEDLSCRSRYICSRALDALQNCNEKKIGELMSENHILLQEIGVSHKKIDKLVQFCLEKGAFGAKLTGAGGGGSIIALTSKENKSGIITEINKECSYQCIPVKIDFCGLLTY